jgi:hypothetical protein
MPANLPPDYFVEEKKLREAKTIDEKISIIERMIAIAPHHKGTDKLIGSLRAKIAKLKEEKERRPQAQRRTDTLYNIKKEGAGQVLFLGFPNSGKSSIISALSGEPLEVADYPFTTRYLQQRMMRYEDILIQLIDTPAIGDESLPMWFNHMVAKADAIVIVVSLSDALDVGYELVMEELRPVLTKEGRRNDSIILCVNKFDLMQYRGDYERFERQLGGKVAILPISAKAEININPLKEMIFKAISVIRVYSKIPGKKPDMEVPFVLKYGSTVIECAEKIHKDFVEKLRYAKLWREGFYDGIMVSKDFILEDRDIIELRI